ncbi:29158_t:CDS:2 [Gigaspora margarita]|uniref:29158_t:CDS:1 n=1 Tax=Gigaspora margarita TaxID=4874 RepID=A0ABN7VNS9_GIGMA|nr:29158_t:CDS:2 [Gigaspora margarita]
MEIEYGNFDEQSDDEYDELLELYEDKPLRKHIPQLKLLLIHMDLEFEKGVLKKIQIIIKLQEHKDLDAQPLVNLLTVFLSKLVEELLISTTILQTNDSANLFLVTDEMSTSASFSSQKTNSSKECSKSNIISKVLPIKVANPVKKLEDSKDHNHQWHLKHENKNYDSLIICEFCDSHSHKKKLYNNDFIEANESGQANSDKSE